MTPPAAVETAADAPVTWRNPWRVLPGVRGAVQAAYVLFFALVGVEFHAFYRQAVSGGPITARRPPAVEGFLPISALIGLKRFLLTGEYDQVHPAGLAILSAAILSAFAARKAFCSWVCPIGGISRALEWAGARLLWRRRREPLLVPRAADTALSSLKYLLLAFFLWAVGLRMDAAALAAFQHSAYNLAADAKMLLFFLDLSRTAAVVLFVLVVLSLVVKNFWCRYLCPYGALLGLASWASPLRVARDARACIDCRACTRACPAEIAVHRKDSVRTPECTGCMSCVAACPVRDCLTVAGAGRPRWSPWAVPAAALSTIYAVWALARLTGRWHTALSPETLAQAYRIAERLAHP